MRASELARTVRAELPGLAVCPERGAAPAFGRLAGMGALRAVLPEAEGGCHLGTDPAGTPALCDMLRRLGRADLSLARLFEGHVNAVRLVETHAGPPVRNRLRRAVAAGAVCGVWGADGPEPLRFVECPCGGRRLAGAKRYASGLGLVTHAIVTAAGSEGGAPRMLLVEAGDPARHDAGAWTASAMRATRSGVFDATDLEVGPDGAVGEPGALTVEPHFEGGVWRYCAAHVGGAEALLGAVRDALAASGRLGDPVQRARLGRALALAEAARRVVEAAAVAVEGAAGGSARRIERAVAQALLAREATEALCVEVLTLSERALGMAAQDAAGPADRIRRDLSLYLRQAAPDAKLDRAVAALCDGESPEVGEAW
jgi:hypothetical protein